MSQSTVVLTIDKNHLRDLFLPALEKDRAAIEYMSSLQFGAGGIPHLSRAIVALEMLFSEGVKTVRDCGGLLLIGGEF